MKSAWSRATLAHQSPPVARSLLVALAVILAVATECLDQEPSAAKFAVKLSVSAAAVVAALAVAGATGCLDPTVL